MISSKPSSTAVYLRVPKKPRASLTCIAVTPITDDHAYLYHYIVETVFSITAAILKHWVTTLLGVTNNFFLGSSISKQKKTSVARATKM